MMSAASRVDLPRAVKRLLDLTLAVIALGLVAPVIAACVVVIRLKSPGPAIFRQVREGRFGRPFVMLKLRTMHRNADALLERLLASDEAARREWASYRRLADDPRVIGRFGRWLRRWSLDELPQLWNVVVGDMSLVGPRPLELNLADGLPPQDIALRRQVRPGLTGLWQVSGRSDHDLAGQTRLDAAYVRGWSLWSDLKILFRTPGAVLSGWGAY